MSNAGLAANLAEAEDALRNERSDQALALLDGFSPTDRNQEIRQLWVLGVAYNKQDRPRAAIAPLDRLVALSPDNPTYRLELAVALWRANQTERARYHFSLAKGAGLDPVLEAEVQDAIDAIDRRRDWQGYLRFALVPETNAARRTAAETIDLAGLKFSLTPESRAQAGTGVELGFGLAALPALSDNLRLRLGLDVLSRTYDSDIADDAIYRASVGFLQFGDRGRQIAGNIYLSDRWLDRAEYARTVGVDLRFARLIGDRINLAGGLLRERTSYDLYAVDRTAANLDVTHATTAQLQIKGGIRAEQRNSSYDLAGGQAGGVTIGGQYIFTGGISANLSLNYDVDQFDGVSQLFGVGRTDHRASAILLMTNQNWSYLGFAPVLRLGVERQRSTIVLNDYRNATASISLTRSF